ncbi:MAG: hypothetical protein CVU87_07465 [Firmicutes bacterium HGW-Firmicutes-12]|nr:MAG: hypothetical protein CVU87_07465 [Firmicutes bacterium HGW-Firmicutes-12]
MKINPNEVEIGVAADLLVNRYNISSHLLGQLFGVDSRNQANSIRKDLGHSTLSRMELAKLLIFRKGSALFSGSSEEVKKLRRYLLSQLDANDLRILFEKHASEDNSINSPSYMITPLVNKKWHPNGRWSSDFVKMLEFPDILAGVKQTKNLPTITDVESLSPIPKLVQFQQNLKDKMLQVLNNEGDRTRCIVTLPTGGGKTRVAVESFIDWMQPRFSEGKYLVWIAQSEELCEQVISCVQQMWGSREFVSPLRIYRFYGGRDIPHDELHGGVVVSSIQQLYSRIKSDDEALDKILINTGAMIIDEAHRAVSAMYDSLLNKAILLKGIELFPICGLSATPGRTGINKQDEITKLVNRFQAYLVEPDLGEEYKNDPLRYFRENGYLAYAKHITYRSGKEYTLTDQEISQISVDFDEQLGPLFLKRLAKDNERNLLIIKKLLSIPKGKPTLVYACTVEQAHFLSVILTSEGRPAGAISSDTPLTIRRGLIQDFKKGKIDFLCNYGVLTTGFDAPKTEYVVICRPMTSVILYEQIIGRGVRGPKFGGTNECCVIDFYDNIHRLGPSLAYARFSDYWISEENQ